VRAIFSDTVTVQAVVRKSNLSSHGARLEFKAGYYPTAILDGRQNSRGGHEGYEIGAQLRCKVSLAKRVVDIQVTDFLTAKANTKPNSKDGTSAKI
jgi:hypothetical protein